MFWRLIAGLACIVFAGIAVSAEPALVVLYRDKPPYSYTQNGRPSGFLFERTVDIVKRAGLQAEFEEAPIKRITKVIQNTTTPVCSPGWYKLPEREAYAQFSVATHEDKPHLILAGAHAAQRICAMKLIRRVFANPDFRLGKVSGISYGAKLDAMIAGATKLPMDSTVSPVGSQNDQGQAGRLHAH